jgi:F-type H+-transporting ATPase subunit b
MLFEAKESAETWRRDYLNKVRQEIDEARASWRKGIDAERQTFIQEVRRGIGKQVYDISRRALADLADAELEQQILQVFLRRIHEMEAHQRNTLIEATKKSPDQIVLRSAFEISPADRQHILQAVRQAVTPELEVDFEVKPDLVCGVELSIQDYKLAWSLDEYLGSLEERLFETLGESAERVYAG